MSDENSKINGSFSHECKFCKKPFSTFSDSGSFTCSCGCTQNFTKSDAKIIKESTPQESTPQEKITSIENQNYYSNAQKIILLCSNSIVLSNRGFLKVKNLQSNDKIAGLNDSGNVVFRKINNVELFGPQESFQFYSEYNFVEIPSDNIINSTENCLIPASELEIDNALPSLTDSQKSDFQVLTKTIPDNQLTKSICYVLGACHLKDESIGLLSFILPSDKMREHLNDLITNEIIPKFGGKVTFKNVGFGQKYYLRGANLVLHYESKKFYSFAENLLKLDGIQQLFQTSIKNIDHFLTSFSLIGIHRRNDRVLFTSSKIGFNVDRKDDFPRFLQTVGALSTQTCFENPLHSFSDNVENPLSILIPSISKKSFNIIHSKSSLLLPCHKIELDDGISPFVDGIIITYQSKTSEANEIRKKITGLNYSESNGIDRPTKNPEKYRGYENFDGTWKKRN